MNCPTITLSTCCRNRTEHLKQTFLKNLEDNPQDYVRFLLLNYNSQDDLDDWVRSELSDHVESGRLLYVHEKTAERFKHAHARNVAVRACNTDVICNVDADNFTGTGFGEWLYQMYLDAADRPVFTAWHRGCPAGDIFGRISFRVRHLIALGGYSEELNQWGVEDWDVIKRAERAGLECIDYPNKFEIPAIPHEGTTRIYGTGYGTPLESLEASAKMQMAKFGTGQSPNAKGAWGRATVEVNWDRTVDLPLTAGETLS